MQRVILSMVILEEDLDRARAFAANLQRNIDQAVAAIDPHTKPRLVKAWVDTSIHQGLVVDAQQSAQTITPQTRPIETPQAVAGDIGPTDVASLGNDEGRLYG